MPDIILNDELDLSSLFSPDLSTITKQPDPSGYKKSPDDAIALKEEEGFTIIYGDDHTLLLDLDGLQDLIWFEHAYPKVSKTFRIQEVERWKSKSGKGTHIVLHSDSHLSIVERLALQCILGSDRMRELYSLNRVWNGIEEKKVSILFKPKSDAS